VGAVTLLHLFGLAGHTGIIPVPAQVEPDGRFPTVRFPNPEEPGALDLAMAMAVEERADLVLANDPDADRLAAALPDADGWRLLSGNELGALLGDYVLRYWSQPEIPIVVNSIVSSPMMSRIASLRGARHESTLTGFKWIISAGLALESAGEGRFAFGYEEALGYSVGRTVRDKDGMSAAVIMADLTAEEAARGRSPLDRLNDLWDEVGLWVSSQHSIVRTGAEGQAALIAAVDRVAMEPPKEILGIPITGMTDYRTGADRRPPWLGAQDLVELDLGDIGRILVRPSGTEPKLKIYVDLSGTTEPDHVTAHAALSARAQAMAVEMGEWLGI
jgi:phosphomannomutase